MIRARLKEGLVVFRTGEEDNDKVVKIESLVKTLNNILALGHTSSYGNGIEVDFNCLKGVQAVHSVNGITLISENGDCEIKDIVMDEIEPDVALE
ncbi:MAG: hypothetical protein RR744_10545 [Cellulosilyticaceae bacterium]